jgi:hypothetical protein
VITEKTTTAEKEKLLADYEDRRASYESQFHAYRTWLDEDARTSSILTTSMEDRFAVDIVEFEQTHQMWSFFHQNYESTGQSIYLATMSELIRCGLFFIKNMSLLDSLSILLLFIRSSFFDRVTLQLMTFFISFLLFGISLTLLTLSCLLPLASHAEIRRLHLSFIGPTTF